MPHHGDDPFPAGAHRVTGRGSDLGIEVEGATVGACLAAAVAGLASVVADVPDDAARRTEAVTIAGDAPVELLVGVVDEVIVRLDADGALAIALTSADFEDGAVRGELELVALDDVTARGSTPKAATWHGARLEQDGDRWTGHVMVDL